MSKRNLVDIDCLSNGGGKAVYGGRLDAYSFFETTGEAWFHDFAEDVVAALGKRYLPVYRLADGEFHYLFGARINWHRRTLISIARYIKYEIIKRPWKTAWNEEYSPEQTAALRRQLQASMKSIAAVGKLALYWNENALHAYTEYNREMESLFRKMGIPLTAENYIPFHFGQALIAKYHHKTIRGNNVLVVAGMGAEEFSVLKDELLTLGAKNVEQYRCSATSALTDSYTGVQPAIKPDIVFVAAGIGAARVLADLAHLECPVIDIGSYINVISGKLKAAHSGFFMKPAIRQYAD